MMKLSYLNTGSSNSSFNNIINGLNVTVLKTKSNKAFSVGKTSEISILSK